MELPSVPHQPKSFDFPKRSFGKKVIVKRSFQAHGLIGGLGFII